MISIEKISVERFVNISVYRVYFVFEIFRTTDTRTCRKTKANEKEFVCHRESILSFFNLSFSVRFWYQLIEIFLDSCDDTFDDDDDGDDDFLVYLIQYFLIDDLH